MKSYIVQTGNKDQHKLKHGQVLFNQYFFRRALEFDHTLFSEAVFTPNWVIAEVHSWISIENLMSCMLEDGEINLGKLQQLNKEI